MEAMAGARRHHATPDGHAHASFERSHPGSARKETPLSERKSLWYLGFSLYWAWVYLSFNSTDIVGAFPDGSPVIPVLHVTSGLTGCLSFVIIIAFHRRIEASGRPHALEWAAAALTTVGTLLYTLPSAEITQGVVLVGAVVSGAASPVIALGWGIVYCRLDARGAAAHTAGSFVMSGALYVAVCSLPSPLDVLAVAALPLACVASLVACDRVRAGATQGSEAGGGRASTPRETLASKLSDLALARGGQGRLLLGIFLTMLVCGGLRVYIMHLDVDVYTDPLLMAAPIALVSLLFLAYGASVSRTSLNLGALYRTTLPLFATAIAATAIANLPDARISFLVVTAGATLIDMVTWVLLVEVSRTTHFPALLVFAMGRLAIHAGMATGELAALRFQQDMTAFFAVSIVMLLVVAGYLFADRDATFAFEPPLAQELPRSPDGQHPVTLSQGLDAIAGRYGLSPRETDVFRLWATRHGSRSIEERLALSPATVKTHLRHIYEKCQVHSRAELLSLIEETLGDATGELFVEAEDERGAEGRKV